MEGLQHGMNQIKWLIGPFASINFLLLACWFGTLDIELSVECNILIWPNGPAEMHFSRQVKCDCWGCKYSRKAIVFHSCEGWREKNADWILIAWVYFKNAQKSLNIRSCCWLNCWIQCGLWWCWWRGIKRVDVTINVYTNTWFLRAETWKLSLLCIFLFAKNHRGSCFLKTIYSIFLKNSACVCSALPSCNKPLDMNAIDRK